MFGIGMGEIVVLIVVAMVVVGAVRWASLRSMARGPSSQESDDRPDDESSTGR